MVNGRSPLVGLMRWPYVSDRAWTDKLGVRRNVGLTKPTNTMRSYLTENCRGPNLGTLVSIGWNVRELPAKITNVKITITVADFPALTGIGVMSMKRLTMMAGKNAACPSAKTPFFSVTTINTE